MRRTVVVFILIFLFNTPFLVGQHFQNTCNPDTFAVDTIGDHINWTQFPKFSTPFSICYHGKVSQDSLLSMLDRGFTHISANGSDFIDTVPVDSRVYLWTGIANADNWALNTKQPWRMIKSPWNNDIPGYRQKWKGRLNSVKNWWKTSDPGVKEWDYVVLDLEWAHHTNSAILGIKNDSLVPPQYQSLSDSLFIVEYKNAMTELYNEPIKLLQDEFHDDIEITTYSEVPIRRTWWSIDDYSWCEWSTDSSLVDYLAFDSLGNFYSDFLDNHDFISPSAYYFYNPDSTATGRDYLGYLLFQLESNQKWISKEQLLFVWMKFHPCCSSQEPVLPYMAEASAIFPLVSGYKNLFNWKFSSSDSPTYEYFIKGLFRLSHFNSFFDGSEEYFSPNTGHQSFMNNEPIWRAVINNGRILVAAHNPYQNSSDTTILVLDYESWQDSIGIVGNEVFLCDFPLYGTDVVLDTSYIQVLADKELLPLIIEYQSGQYNLTISDENDVLLEEFDISDYKMIDLDSYIENPLIVRIWSEDFSEMLYRYYVFK